MTGTSLKFATRVLADIGGGLIMVLAGTAFMIYAFLASEGLK